MNNEKEIEAAPVAPVIPAPRVETWQERMGENWHQQTAQLCNDAMLAEIRDLRAHIARQAQPTDRGAEPYKDLFFDACADLGLINEELGLDPDDGGAEPILEAIRALKSEQKG